MRDITRVVIAIQARSTSTRLPRKCFEWIDEDNKSKPMLQFVIDQCKSSGIYLNKHTDKNDLSIQVALLIPEKDEIGQVFKNKLTIIEGDEMNVLSRYNEMACKLDPHIVVRVTGDCPLISPHLITKHIITSAKYSYDYLSNVSENSRTSADGLDCEAFSAGLLYHTHDNATDAYDREHVTPFMRNMKPEWAKTGAFVDFLDMSSIKLSVDTQEDLDLVRDQYKKIKEKFKRAVNEHGSFNVHRL